jgi:uncharacterized protein YkwD
VAGAALAVLALAAGLLLGPAAPSAAAAQCANAEAERGEATLRQMKRALVCLINRQRRRADKRALDPNRKLNRAATSHTEVMVAQDCFLHKCPGEPGFGARVRQTGYPDGADRWKAAENLAYAPTPLKAFRAMMEKRFSRRNILKGKFRDIGIGARPGAPVAGEPDDEDVTYTVVFAWRRG